MLTWQHHPDVKQIILNSDPSSVSSIVRPCPYRTRRVKQQNIRTSTNTKGLKPSNLMKESIN